MFGELHRIEASVERLERRIDRLVLRITRLELIAHAVQSFSIHQIHQIHQTDGGYMANSITGVVAGAVGKFAALAVPAGSVVSGSPVWASDNVLAVVAADPADATGLSCTVTVDAAAVGSFNLSISTTRTDGVIATGTASVPVLPAPPPPPVLVASFDINQTA
jgi:hypothetical protein